MKTKMVNPETETKCSTFYRGLNAFSEAETSGISTLIGQMNSPKIAINLESFTNSITIPYSYIASYFIDKEDSHWFYSNLKNLTISPASVIGNHYAV
jgi:hypothetical protein